MARSLKILPYRILYGSSPAKNIIKKDIVVWIQLNDPGRSNSPVLDNLEWLVENFREFRNQLNYRFSYPSRLLDRFLLVLAKTLYRPYESLFISSPSIGPGLYIQHGISTVIEAEKIGENCWVTQQVTIGPGEGLNLPTLGNNVHVFPGAKILGKVTIGDNVRVAANAVVEEDVPPDCTVAGVPARIIRRAGKGLED